MFYSDSPTNFPKIYGPSTLVKLFAFNDFASCLAIKVLPVPGGPNNKIPFTCFNPNFSIIEWGSLLDANALLNMSESCWLSPPMPNASNEKFFPKISFWISFEDLSLIFWFADALHVIFVYLLRYEKPSSAPKTLSMVRTYLLFL